jgi:hypothetical protein
MSWRYTPALHRGTLSLSHRSHGAMGQRHVVCTMIGVLSYGLWRPGLKGGRSALRRRQRCGCSAVRRYAGGPTRSSLPQAAAVRHGPYGVPGSRWISVVEGVWSTREADGLLATPLGSSYIAWVVR